MSKDKESESFEEALQDSIDNTVKLIAHHKKLLEEKDEIIKDLKVKLYASETQNAVYKGFLDSIKQEMGEE